MSEEEHHGHVVPVRVYVAVWISLMVLLLITVGASLVDFGHTWINVVIMLTIAVAKMMLILLYFMHVRYSSKLTMVFAGAGFAWLLLLFGLTGADFVTRPEGARLEENVPHQETVHEPGETHQNDSPHTEADIEGKVVVGPELQLDPPQYL